MMKFKNNGIKSGDFDKIVHESNKLYKEYKLDKYNIQVVVSKRFGTKTNGNILITGIYGHEMNVRIALNYKVYENIGIDAVMGTVKHEFAHLIAYDKTNKVDHGTKFKEVCLKLGGHMNDDFAKGKYAACSNNNYFLPSHMKKYKMTCNGCGQVLRRDRINKKLLNKICRCGEAVRNFKVTQNH